MKRFVTVLMCLLFMGWGEVSYAKNEQTNKPEFIGLLFYADWCSSCKVLEPKLNPVKKDFAGRQILFARVDLTNEFTREQSKLFVGWVGLGDVFQQYGDKTGFMLIIRLKDTAVLSRLVKTQTEDELRKEIRKALRN